VKVCQLCAVDFTLKKLLLPLIDRQVANGDEVIAVCSNGEQIEAMRDSGYSIHTIPIERSMHPLKHLRSIWTLYWYFRRESFDVVHVHTPVAALLGRIAAFLARVPLVVYTAHGFYFHDDMAFASKKIHIGLEQFAGKFTDILFTQSMEDAENAIILGIKEKDRVFAIGNGVDVSRFHPSVKHLRKSLRIPEKKFVVGMIARLVEEKGVKEFLQAAMRIAKEKPDIYFMLVGGRLTSEHNSAVNNIIEQAHEALGDNLILLGFRDDIPELLATMDVFCLPSWREGMPRTIIEAMMMGLPVIATDIRGSREEVVHEETGFLVPAHDSRKLAEAIFRLIRDPQLVSSMGLKGREKALLLYDEGKVIDMQIRLIRRFYEFEC
jgi:glycosyltransferase involved in cell wall biosynthesis